MTTQARGASNAKAKRELGWQPRYASCGRASRRDSAKARQHANGGVCAATDLDDNEIGFRRGRPTGVSRIEILGRYPAVSREFRAKQATGLCT